MAQFLHGAFGAVGNATFPPNVFNTHHPYITYSPTPEKKRTHYAYRLCFFFLRAGISSIPIADDSPLIDRYCFNLAAHAADETPSGHRGGGERLPCLPSASRRLPDSRARGGRSGGTPRAHWKPPFRRYARAAMKANAAAASAWLLAAVTRDGHGTDTWRRGDVASTGARAAHVPSQRHNRREQRTEGVRAADRRGEGGARTWWHLGWEVQYSIAVG